MILHILYRLIFRKRDEFDVPEEMQDNSYANYYATRGLNKLINPDLCQRTQQGHITIEELRAMVNLPPIDKSKKGGDSTTFPFGLPF